MRQQPIVSVGGGILLCLLLIPVDTSAQTPSAGTVIAGVVRDTSGAVLPGVTVEASSPALIERVRSTVTDERGQYRLLDLRPGTYVVTYTLPGFSVFRREGIELTTNFTATINVEMRLGAIEETVTVTGQTPLVDVQNVTQTQTITRTVLDTVPTARGILGYASLMPNVIVPPLATDVGGIRGEVSVRMSIHGGKQSDQKLLYDGMRYNALQQDGNGRGYYINPATAEEVVVDVGSGGNAEYNTGGAQVNIVPRDGGNRFVMTLFTAYTGHRMQADNLDDDLRAKGLTTVNGIRNVYDVNAVFAGPIVKDRLWFITSPRWWGTTTRVANLFHDANLDDWVFTPDLSRPVDPEERYKEYNFRLTWQVAAKHKVTGSLNRQTNVTDHNAGQLNSGTIAIEAQTGYCPKPRLYQSTWTNPATNRLLFEAGITHLKHDRIEYPTPNCGRESDRVSIQTPGFRFHGTGSRDNQHSNHNNGRFSTSYIAGSHTVKTGMFFQYDTDLASLTIREPKDIGGLPLSYSFTNGVPTSLTQFAAPQATREHVRPDLALFIQDQWSLGRLTLNGGVRYEYLRSWVPAIERPAGRLTDAASFDDVKCLPCWHDINPRIGAAVDLFGDGKTALKAGLGRYVESRTNGLTLIFAPAYATVNSTTRAWTDTNGNYLPDCDLRSPDANGECGPMASRSFGQTRLVNRPDPDWITGWQNRGYNWRASVEIDRELMPGVAMTAGVYRTWYGNHVVTDNQEVRPEDFDPYCITAPVDPRLPSNVSGAQICGLYDIKPEKFGRVDNVYTLAKNFGTQTEVYNGADINFTARIPGGGRVAGGWNVGNSVSPTTGSGAAGVTSSKAKRCFVVDSPQELYNCETGNPYQHRFKVNGSYPLPWDLQAAFVFQTHPGPNYTATITVPSAQIAPSLGRPLAGGVRNLAIELIQPLSQFLDNRITQLDLRLTKIFRFGGARRVQVNFDLYNLFNDNAILGMNTVYGGAAPWLRPAQIHDGRLFKLSTQLEF